MPNWCMNTVSFFGSKSDVEELVALLDSVGIEEEGCVFDFSRILPEPEFSGEKQAGVMPDWYTWRVNTWGTKWNACSVEVINPIQDYQPSVNSDEISPLSMITYAFDTAWAPPVGVMEAIAELYPRVAIHHFYDEPGMDFSGLITSQGDGEGIFDDGFGFSISNRKNMTDAYDWMDWQYDGPLTKVKKNED